MTSTSITLQSLGYTPSLAQYLVGQNLTAFEPGRVVAEHKERYLSICYASKVTPVVVLTKTDLVTTDYLAERIATINARQAHIDVLAVSNTSQAGYAQLEAAMEPGKTYCLLGSSGVGKSTLTNNLCGDTLMKTDTISDSTGKGRHVTSHRELIVLPNGAILIDNPGMREVGVADAGQGLEQSFDTIAYYAQQCRYHDCTHRSEKGCAVLEALDNGDIPMAAYENYLKIAQESAFFESTELERKKKDKQLGKQLKHYDKLNVKGKKNEDGGL